MIDLVAQPVPRFTMDAALDAYVEKRTGPRENDFAYHPSSLYQCDRKVIYEVRGTPREDVFRPGDNRPLLIGNVLGPVLQEAAMEQVGTSLRYAVAEPRVEIPGLGIVGNADLLVQHADGTWELVENKTINSNGLRMSKKSGEFPKPDHVNQGMTYLYGIREHGYTVPDEWVSYDEIKKCALCGTFFAHSHPAIPDLKWLRVCYWDKDRHAIHESRHRITAEWEDQFIEHMQKLDRYKADGVALPPRLAQNADDHWLCRSYCQFRNRCFNTDSEGVVL